MSTTKAPEALLKRLRDDNRFLLTSHANPDGDAVGSEIGLARILRSLGKGAVIWNRDEAPSLYRELPGVTRIHTGDEPPAGFPEAFDSVVVLECPSLDRTGLEEHLAELPQLNIDHHMGNEHYAEVNWVDPAAPAVGEMVFRLAQGLMMELDAQTATALFLTLVSDTGGFRFPNATADAFDAAAALVREGARPEQVAEWLYESRPETSIRLLGEMLQSLQLHADGAIATALLSREMFESSGAQTSDTEGLVDVPRSIAGVRSVALVRQTGDDQFKVSLRSTGDIDVERIARAAGGGGHKNAAGFVAEGDMEEIRQRLVTELTEALA
jgi:phosphoesterase RecJ-like protein